MDAMKMSLTAIEAARLRMEVSASNLANAQTSAPLDGAPPAVQRVVQRELEFETTLRGVEATVVDEDRAPRMEIDPSHPDADALGRVFYPDVSIPEEMGEMMTARRSFEVGLATYAEAKAMYQKTLEIGQA